MLERGCCDLHVPVWTCCLLCLCRALSHIRAQLQSWILPLWHNVNCSQAPAAFGLRRVSYRGTKTGCLASKPSTVCCLRPKDLIPAFSTVGKWRCAWCGCTHQSLGIGRLGSCTSPLREKLVLMGWDFLKPHWQHSLLG